MSQSALISCSYCNKRIPRDECILGTGIFQGREMCAHCADRVRDRDTPTAPRADDARMPERAGLITCSYCNQMLPRDQFIFQGSGKVMCPACAERFRHAPVTNASAKSDLFAYLTAYLLLCLAVVYVLPVAALVIFVVGLIFVVGKAILGPAFCRSTRPADHSQKPGDKWLRWTAIISFVSGTISLAIAYFNLPEPMKIGQVGFSAGIIATAIAYHYVGSFICWGLILGVGMIMYKSLNKE